MLSILLIIVSVFATILISVIIFIISHSKSEGSSFQWDKIVILDNVIKAQSTFLIFLLILTSLLFWNTYVIVKIIILAWFFCGIFLLSKVLYNAYHWIKEQIQL